MRTVGAHLIAVTTTEEHRLDHMVLEPKSPSTVAELVSCICPLVMRTLLRPAFAFVARLAGFGTDIACLGNSNYT